MQAAYDWLQKNHEKIIRNLADLVAIPSISTDGEHAHEIERTAKLTCDQMREAGLTNVEVLRVGSSLPYAYGEWLGAPGKPTVFLYAHHDVQPVNYREQWETDPWHLTRKDGRLYARGAADDKGAVAAQLGAIAAYMQTNGSLPVNIKMLVEGEEEVGSKNLMQFFERHKSKLQSDVIIVCDTENIEVGLPCITYSLRGIVQAHVQVKSAEIPVHSGMAGGALPDAAIALNVLLSRLFWDNAPYNIPGMYDQVRQCTEKEKAAFRKLPGDENKWRKDCGVLPQVRFAMEKGMTPYEQTWRRPAVTIIAQEASNVKRASNQVLPTAEAIVSCRIVPDQEPEKVFKSLEEVLTKDAPWGVQVTVTNTGMVGWWMTDPNGPAFEAALGALRKGFGKDPVAIGSGGSIGFVGPLAELFGGAPALLLGIEDPASNAHAPNESLHEGDFKKLMISLVDLFDNLGKLPGGKVK
ncbi:M20/M25/M40 family metallo-hydrolase [Telmatocola sphagniphila]|uniref:M20/M25/M40 family metallo-hydrolase n=1 Tax=Telmatocola sphagniphila TaxID=1123043 RepID=A0A8E6EXA8_9BACT|nr:M20/M25/M40 family metallo-hydrolase [Telmatocola sphagniphila]QVL34687.1 M20/M25/M40 family metallo-hydrolase [Telmatocola sphagniphila]